MPPDHATSAKAARPIRLAAPPRRTWTTAALIKDHLGGFSLLELLVCIAIIALLVSFLVYSFVAVWKFVHKVIDMAQG